MSSSSVINRAVDLELELNERVPTDEQANQRLTRSNQLFTETNGGELLLDSTVGPTVKSSEDGLGVLCSHYALQTDQIVSSGVDLISKASVGGAIPSSTCYIPPLAPQPTSKDKTVTSDFQNASHSNHLETKATLLDCDSPCNITIQESDIQVREDSKTILSCVLIEPLVQPSCELRPHQDTGTALKIQSVDAPIDCTLSNSKDVLCDNKLNANPGPKNEVGGLVQTGTNECDVEMESQVSRAPREGMEDTKRRRRRKRNNGDSQVESMDHSGLEQETKRPKLLYKDGVMLCLPLSSDIVEKGPPEAVARELARCLHEPKHILIGEVVRVLGIETTLDLFQKTADIQESGGQSAVDGDKKKAPGGVFLFLVKQTATPEEKQEMFRKDKQITEQKKKMERKRKWMEREKREKASLERKAEWELRVFQAQLHDPSPSLTEWDCSLSELRQKDTNVHKRLGKRPTVAESKINYTKMYNGGRTAKGAEAMDVETNADRQPIKSNGLSQHSGKVLDQERQAAEEFEQMKECQLDFGFDLD